MTINNQWKLFFYGVNRDHYEKLIGIIELSQRLALNFFNDKFSTDTKGPDKDVPLLDEIDYGDTVSTCRAIIQVNFIVCIVSI